MYNVLIDFAQHHLFMHALLIFLSTLALLLAMGVDLIFGVRKAKQLGKATTSTGYKKTCEKGRKYFSPYIVLICIDLITCVIVPFPAFSMAWAAWCVYCEFKSVREKAWQKEELRNAENTMNVVIQNKDDLAKTLKELIFNSSNETTNKDEKDKSNNSAL